MIYSLLAEYLGTIVKLGPLANRELSTSMRGFKVRFLTHLAMILVGAGVPGLKDVETIVVVAVVVMFV